MEKKKIFSRFLKMATDSAALVELGRSFHQQGTVGKGPILSDIKH